MVQVCLLKIWMNSSTSLWVFAYLYPKCCCKLENRLNGFCLASSVYIPNVVAHFQKNSSDLVFQKLWKENQVPNNLGNNSFRFELEMFESIIEYFLMYIWLIFFNSYLNNSIVKRSARYFTELKIEGKQGMLLDCVKLCF